MIKLNSMTNDPDPALDPANAVMVESSNKNKTIIGVIVGVVLLIAGIGIGIGVHNGGGGEEWNNLCLRCQAKECYDGEIGVSTQCLNDTVACIYETVNSGKISRYCGPLDELPPSLKLNGCVQMGGNNVCSCNLDNCNDGDPRDL